MIQDISLESKLMLILEERGLSVFTTDDAKDILKTSDSSVWHILNKLARKNRIRRIERGRYLLIPTKAGMDGHWAEYHWAIIPRLIDTYYIGFWSAIDFWDMTEQIPYHAIAATTRRKRDLEFGGQRFEFVTVSEKKFFGFIEWKTKDGQCFNISSREKTIVDGLTHPEYCGGMVEVIKAIWNARRDVDWHVVLDMARRVEINVVLKRLGYSLAILGIEERISEKVMEGIKRSPRQRFDPTRDGYRIEISKEYGLIINRPKYELLAWMDS